MSVHTATVAAIAIVWVSKGQGMVPRHHCLPCHCRCYRHHADKQGAGDDDVVSFLALFPSTCTRVCPAAVAAITIARQARDSCIGHCHSSFDTAVVSSPQQPHCCHGSHVAAAAALLPQQLGCCCCVVISAAALLPQQPHFRHRIATTAAAMLPLHHPRSSVMPPQKLCFHCCSLPQQRVAHT